MDILKKMILVVSLLTYNAVANAEVCPIQIQTQQKITEPSGWKTISRTSTSLLSGFVIYYDNPDTKREWAPEGVKKVADKYFYVYKLPKITKDVWVDCSYTTSNLILRKQLATSIRQCDVILIRHQTLIESVTCK
jgi:hypothetical protein